MFYDKIAFMRDNSDLFVTATWVSAPPCKHANGWFKTVRFKKWGFEFKQRYFVCTDCCELITEKEIKE